VYEEAFPDITQADLVIVGCEEYRGNGNFSVKEGSADAVRKSFYSLYHWHKDVTVADIGNMKKGESVQDSYAAVKTVVTELIEAGKRVVIIGGSHDITLAQYGAYVQQQKIIEAVCVDAKIDLDMDSALPAENF